MSVSPLVKQENRPTHSRITDAEALRRNSSPSNPRGGLVSSHWGQMPSLEYPCSIRERRTRPA